MGDRSQTEYSTLAPLHSLSLEDNSSLLVWATSSGFARDGGASKGQKVHQRSLVFPSALTPASHAFYPSLEPQQLPRRGYRPGGPELGELRQKIRCCLWSSHRGWQEADGRWPGLMGSPAARAQGPVLGKGVPLPPEPGKRTEFGILKAHLSSISAIHPVQGHNFAVAPSVSLSLD